MLVGMHRDKASFEELAHIEDHYLPHWPQNVGIIGLWLHCATIGRPCRDQEKKVQ